jgi:hypothetical protein
MNLLVNYGIRAGGAPKIEYMNATGGTTLEYNLAGKRYRSHIFTSSTNFIVTELSTVDVTRNQVEYLIVAGGASAGGTFSYAGNSFTGTGGGGAGGLLSSVVGDQSGAASSPLSKPTVSVQSYPVTIGAGGANSNGGDSTAFGLTAIGGGRGGMPFGSAGGSGGGGGSAKQTTSYSGGAGTAGQGRNGGQGRGDYAYAYYSGGGGGAGAVGVASTGWFGNRKSGEGGNGLPTSIIPSTASYGQLNSGARWFAGGGGGGGDSDRSASGGIGGGGASSLGVGGANTGGGGGGSYRGGGGAGGSGIVIIRYEIAPA